MTDQERLAELERRVTELEKKLKDYWLLDKNSPDLVSFSTTYECPRCHSRCDSTRLHLCLYPDSKRTI